MGSLFDVLGSCLMDMAKMGIVEEAKVDSFNVPVYSTTPQEIKKLIERNGCFNIERIVDILPQENKLKEFSAQTYSDHTRAVMEVVIKLHFGCNEHTIDHLFQHLYPKKFEDTLANLMQSMGKTIVLFIILKRK
ncbi:probable S-adenosylmethionine-dependent methyltransferase At5g38100 [Papaver somniferum]|uniref:probable S-adenosylmethionine-dependent methyltransferase At5g38100 n=1 Tax=Papaver somniferum TaxID=3469 RepID=UPI000E7023D4|nr:probable S-adenosylmethionine-dependent methyltransferase At5g38100 [Papaver somniferum]